MTKQEIAAWAAALKPGDQVIEVGTFYTGSPGENAVGVLTVEKVTPSGIIRTSGGDYKIGKYDHYPRGYGQTTGQIIPYTEEKAVQAREYEAKQKEKREQHRTILAAQNACFCLWKYNV